MRNRIVKSEMLNNYEKVDSLGVFDIYYKE